MWQFRDGDNIKFQSTLPRGERLGLGVDDLTNYLFQSTLPRGERLPKPFKTVLMFHFNPRSREGSDHCCRNPSQRPSDFNPRSREGSDCNFI